MLKQACTYAQSRQNHSHSHTQSMEVDESAGHNSGLCPTVHACLTLYPIETPLQTEQTQIRQPYKSCLIRVYSVCLWKYDISEPTLVDLTSNFFVLCTNVKVYL